MKLFKKLISSVLCICILFAAFGVLSNVGAANISVQNGTGTREPLRVVNTFAYRAIVNAPFTAFSFCMPTWTKTDSACTISIYKWAGTFDSTIKTEPIASKVFDPMVDGAKNRVSFSEQGAGEYLFCVSDPRGDVGVWTNTSPTDPKGFMYENGLEGRGEPELEIIFTSEVEEPFGTCQASESARIPVAPFINGTGEAVSEMSSSCGIRLNTNAPFSGFQIKMATYHATDLTITFSVYKWEGTYDDTVAKAPVAEDSFTMIDNVYQGITFEELPKGDYLFLAHDCSGGSAIYYYSRLEGFEGFVYKDGYLTEGDSAIIPEIKVIFAEDLGQSPYYSACEKSNEGVTGDHTAPAEYVIPEDSLIYTHKVQPDTWVFTDGLGRVSLTNKDVGNVKDDKTLAMFYWSWHIDGFVTQTPANLQKLSEEYPEAMNDFDHPIWKQYSTSYFWNEPIYGYYRTDDAWVLRKQAELLANAGVDVIFTDNTNGTMTWRNSYTVLMDTWSKAMQDGLNTPKVSFMLPFNASEDALNQMQALYLDIFRKDKWHELWFYWEDKPMLMAHKDCLDATEALIQKEISDFFTFRANYPGYTNDEPKLENWGWLSIYPQAAYYNSLSAQKAKDAEQITVGISMNHDYKLGMLAAMNGKNIMGRSYTSEGYHTEENAKLYGYNFAEQFEYALAVDPKVVFVTGWNEWRVGRYETWPEGSDAAVENAFPDQFNDEFSRDIEPSKGDLKDHYYYQLVNYVRRYKGCEPIPTPSKAVTIDIKAGQEQWKNVLPYYAAYIGNTDDRDAKGYGDTVYTETSGRNDIIGAQIARDGEYIYFNVECFEDITPYTDPLWMTLYIDCDQSNQGWETFDYVINKSAAGKDTVVLEKFTSGYASERVADCEYTVDGRYMTVKVKKADLGISGNDFTVNFAWTDNVHDEGDYTKFSGDILDFYISGDVAPGARFKYSYISTEENAQGTAADTEGEGTLPQGTTGQNDTSGKKTDWVIPTVIAGAVVIGAAAAVALGKKKK